MLAAVLLVNETGSYIVRPLVEMAREKVEEIIEVFMSVRKKKASNLSETALDTEIGTFYCQELDDLFVIVLADMASSGSDGFDGNSIQEALKNLEIASKTGIKSKISLNETNTEIFGLIFLIDQLFTAKGVINKSIEGLLKVLSLQSNDEILQQMILKNKEKESLKLRNLGIDKSLKSKDLKVNSAIDELAKEIEEIKILRQDLSHAPQNKPVEPLKKKGQTLMDSMQNKVNIAMYMKYTSVINSTTEFEKTEGIGELQVKILKPELANIAIALKDKPKTARAHPSLDKSLFLQNVLQPKTMLPLNTPLTLMKWSLFQEELFHGEKPIIFNLPIEITFWQTELTEERYKFIIEITAKDLDIKNIFIRVPINRVSDIEMEDSSSLFVKNDDILAEIQGLPKNNSRTMEFSGLCDNTDSLFPFFVQYTIEQTSIIGDSIKVFINQADVLEESSRVLANPSDVTIANVIEGECTVKN